MTEPIEGIPKPKNNSRAKYMKGWYYEQKAKQLITNYNHNPNLFLIKAPYSYPFDLIGFRLFSNEILFVEVRYSANRLIYIYPRKFNKAIDYARKFKNVIIHYVVIGFFGSKYNYKIITFENVANQKRIKEPIKISYADSFKT